MEISRRGLASILSPSPMLIDSPQTSARHEDGYYAQFSGGPATAWPQWLLVAIGSARGRLAAATYSIGFVATQDR